MTENLAKPHPAVHRDTRRIELSAREVMLPKVLMREPARVSTRTELCERFWEHAHEYDTKLVEVFIGRLQKSRRSLVDLHRSPRWLHESLADARFEGAAKVTMALPFQCGRQPRSPRFYGYQANAQTRRQMINHFGNWRDCSPDDVVSSPQIAGQLNATAAIADNDIWAVGFSDLTA